MGESLPRVNAVLTGELLGELLTAFELGLNGEAGGDGFFTGVDVDGVLADGVEKVAGVAGVCDLDDVTVVGLTGEVAVTFLLQLLSETRRKEYRCNKSNSSRSDASSRDR